MGFTTWVTKALAILQTNNLVSTHNVNNAFTRRHIREMLKSKYKERWYNTIHVNEEFPILRTYKLFKNSFGPEPYLKLTNIQCIRHLAKLRMSSHSLAIERGRHVKPIIPAEQRICNLCEVQAVEDEIHVLVKCEKYKSERTILLRYLDIPESQLQTDPLGVFVSMLQSENLKNLNAVSIFIRDIMSIRKASLGH